MPIVIGKDREFALTSDVAGDLADPSEAAVALPSGTDSERLLAVLDDGRAPLDELAPTAAVTAGGDAGGNSFVRLARILETTIRWNSPALRSAAGTISCPACTVPPRPV